MQFRDHLGRMIELKDTPERIVSLVPSQTELLVDLGLEKYIMGITRFCVHPPYLRQIKSKVGGTKKANFRKVRELEPDIILCNKEENTREMVQELEQIAPVHISDVSTLEDANELILQYGEIFNCEPLAKTLTTSILKKVKKLKELASNSPRQKVAYFIWHDPLMVAGKGTFIDSMLELNNFENVFSQERYPQTSFEELGNMKIDSCFLSSEPFPFKEKHKVEFQPYTDKVKIVNGEYFSWYGSRLLEAMDYFKELHLESTN
ncbi:ABC transporter substrate-binding protein [Gramella sp. KN1008]|uniref:ABC transporter substrate-binding protein n=1 Tax=Gramella sp. KN1008 TaxID=2529298 RepID=UPI00103D6096|nr:helical backbone metal receptor [Gramella sp. KN1008]TBW26527.1 cobalamin-binding protein [Gramella sp. KN1008]